MSELTEHRLLKLEETSKDHEIRIRALELGYAKLMLLAAIGAAIGSFLANKVF